MQNLTLPMNTISGPPTYLRDYRLCQDYECGGLSPHPAVLQAVKSRVSIPVYVMIRPHSRDFCYGNDDFETMKATLQLMKELGADGFVFGILHTAPYHRNARNSWVDTTRNKELVQLADGKPCTFHRAFDCIPESDWDNALEDIKGCGFAAILTSGGPSGEKAVDCMDGLADLVHRESCNPGFSTQAGRRALEVIVGGGVRPTNIGVLRETTLAHNFHSSALSPSSKIVSSAVVRDLKRSLLYQGPATSSLELKS